MMGLEGKATELTPAQRQQVLQAHPGLTDSELTTIELEAYYRLIR